MDEKIDWDSLLTTVEVCTQVTEELPEGLYNCPRCHGTGRVSMGHSLGFHPTTLCGMCWGTQAIKRCKSCKDNPVASNDPVGLCDNCERERMDFLIDLAKRPEIICNFPQWTENCGNPHLQETNPKGNLVCSLELCEYSEEKKE